MEPFRINNTRFLQRMAQMAEIGKVQGTGVHRLALSSEDKKARDLLVQWMEKAQLSITIDKIGNMYGVRKGNTSVPPVAFGSHLDSVGFGGRFDGSLGVLAALEVIETLNDNDFNTNSPLCMVNFTNEEGARFAPDMMGSMVVAGVQDLEKTWGSKDLHNPEIILKNELQQIGYLGHEDPVSFRPSAFLELHIEQGPILEQEHKQIGIVEAVQGIYWTEFIVTGQANHAGTTPMELRKDAGLVAYQIASFSREITTMFPTLRATAGLIEVKPNLINVIPGEARITIDFRCPDKRILIDVDKRIYDFARKAAEAEGCVLESKSLTSVEPVNFNEDIVNHVAESAQLLGHSSKRMISGAGHDAQLMAGVVPAAMIFIPSENGISHSVEEFSKPKNCIIGTNVLLNAVISLAG